jgi:hypothetical protein
MIASAGVHTSRFFKCQGRARRIHTRMHACACRTVKTHAYVASAGDGVYMSRARRVNLETRRFTVQGPRRRLESLRCRLEKSRAPPPPPPPTPQPMPILMINKCRVTKSD